MSNIAFELFAKLGLDSSEYERGLGDAKSKASSIGGAISGGLKTVATVGAAAIGAATAAVGAFATSSIQAGQSFDKSMSQVAATMGLSMDEMASQVGTVDLAWGTFSGNLREYAQEMGKNTAFSATEAADALNYMALAGYDAQTSMKMLPNVLNLAAAGGMELATASDMITDTQSALGLSLEETSQLVDKMAKASSKSNTSVAQLGEAMLTIGGTAKNLSGGTTELSQALGLLADNGIKGAEGGTALRNILLNLTPKSEDAAKAMEQIGLQAYDSEGKMRPLKDIFTDLNKGMEGMTDQEKTQILSNIFNKVDLKSVNALLATNVDRWDELSTAIDDSKGAAQKMADTQLDNLAGDITLFQSALEGAKIAVSDNLTPSLREFVQFGTKGLSEITQAFDEGGLSGAMTAFGTILGDGLKMVVDKAPSFVRAGMQLIGSFGKAIIDNTPQIVNAAVDIVVELANGLVKGLPELAKGAITLVKSLGQAFSDNAAELQLVGSNLMDLLLDGLLNGAPKLFSEFAEFFASSFPTLVEKVTGIVVDLALAFTDPTMLGSLAESAITMILALANGLVTAIPQLISAIPVIVQNLVTAIVDNAPMLLEGALSLIGILVQSIIENLPLIIAAGTQIVFSLVGGLIEMLPTIATSAIRLVAEIVRTILSSLPKFIENGVKIVGAIVQGIVKTIGSVVKAAINLVTQFISSINSFASKMIGVGREFVEYIKTGLMQKIEDAKNWGRDLIDNFIGGIKEKLGNLKEAVSGIAETISAPIHFSVPDEGPLSDADTYMPDMMKLFADGIRDNEHLVRNQLYKSFDFSNLIEGAEVELPKSRVASKNNDIIRLLEQIATNRNVTVVLEGDADRLFRVIQREDRRNKQITGVESFA